MNKINFLVLVLFGIILLQHCAKNNKTKEDKIVRIDSIVERIVHDTTFVKIPSQVKYIPKLIKDWDIIYLPSENKDSLKKQYITITTNYLSKNVYLDSIKLTDSFGLKGLVKIKDEIELNKITNREYSVIIDYPKITKIISTKEPIKRALYIGGGIQGNKLSIVNQVSLGLMYKNKKDNLIGIQSSINHNGEVSYGINSYFKIKLK